MQFIGKPLVTTPVGAIPLIYIPSPLVPVNNTQNWTPEVLATQCTQLVKKNSILRKQNEENSKIINEQAEQIKILEKKLSEMEGKVNTTMSQLESELEKTRDQLEEKQLDIQRIRDDLRSLLSETQLNALTQKIERVSWNSDDMAKAFTIYYFSKKCYLYLKHNLKYPLPSISAVEKWALRNDVVLRVPAYEIFKGLKSIDDRPRKRPRII